MRIYFVILVLVLSNASCESSNSFQHAIEKDVISPNLPKPIDLKDSISSDGMNPLELSVVRDSQFINSSSFIFKGEDIFQKELFQNNYVRDSVYIIENRYETGVIDTFLLLKNGVNYSYVFYSSLNDEYYLQFTDITSNGTFGGINIGDSKLQVKRKMAEYFNFDLSTVLVIKVDEIDESMSEVIVDFHDGYVARIQYIPQTIFDLFWNKDYIIERYKFAK